uniref:Putative gag protein n=1 Tax=Coffea canephora TaxID=49390 RepID=A0A0B5CXW2_COFCA|nr:putative gag protein [Coffea canephora]
MATIKVSFLEGQSIDRPPMFNGSHFSMWKQRMMIFLQSVYIELWYVVEDGPYEARIIDSTTNLSRLKTRQELNEKDKRYLSLNAKAMCILYNALDVNESSRIKGCKSAKDIWDKLCVFHEGNQDIKEQKKSLLVSQYEFFKMHPLENVDKMCSRFCDIIEDLKLLGKEYSLGEKNRKILNALPKEWENKINAIEEAKDLNSMSIESLVDTLTSYELKLEFKVQEEENARMYKRGIAFKASQVGDNPSFMGNEIMEVDNDITPHIKSFKKIFNKRCSRGDCKITWDECNSKREKEELAQMALMAVGEDEVSSYHSSCDEDNEDDDVKILMIKMHKSLRKSYAKNKDLKTKINDLLEENSKLFQENKCLRMENDDLKNQKSVFDCKNNLKRKLEEKTKFYEKMLEEQNLLKKRINVLNEFLQNEKQKFSQTKESKSFQGTNNFAMIRSKKISCIKSTYVQNTSIMCHFCCKFGHMQNDCYVKKNMRKGMKSMWIARSCRINSQGPYKERVPNEISHI